MKQKRYCSTCGGTDQPSMECVCEPVNCDRKSQIMARAREIHPADDIGSEQCRWAFEKGANWADENRPSRASLNKTDEDRAKELVYELENGSDDDTLFTRKSDVIFGYKMGLANGRAESKWRSIETAPDDEVVLVFGLRCGTMVALKYNEVWCGLADQGQIHPTHWMEIPERPEKRSLK